MDGIIIVNKEKGYTSNDVVQIVKKIYKEKVGHTGTLDPMATGVLPLLIGKGTRCSKYFINHDKIYTAVLKLGMKTDTGDITGNIVETKIVENKLLDKERICDVLKKFIGEQEQIPPMYSAIKVNGKKLYEYAREGKKIELEPRKIKIYNIDLIDIIENELILNISCSKGTYIRTLCENIAEKLGTIGTMKELNREKVGDFSIKDAVKIEDIKNGKGHVIGIEEIFENKGKIILTPRSFMCFINGVKLYTDEINGIYRIYNENDVFIGTGIVSNGILKRDIIIY